MSSGLCQSFDLVFLRPVDSFIIHVVCHNQWFIRGIWCFSVHMISFSADGTSHEGWIHSLFWGFLLGGDSAELVFLWTHDSFSLLGISLKPWLGDSFMLYGASRAIWFHLLHMVFLFIVDSRSLILVLLRKHGSHSIRYLGISRGYWFVPYAWDFSDKMTHSFLLVFLPESDSFTHNGVSLL